MFTHVAPQTTSNVVQPQKKKKKNNNNNNGGGGVVVAVEQLQTQRLPNMLHRLEFHAMGCDMLVAVENETAPQLLSHVPEWFEEWEQSLSRFRYRQRVDTAQPNP